MMFLRAAKKRRLSEIAATVAVPHNGKHNADEAIEN